MDLSAEVRCILFGFSASRPPQLPSSRQKKARRPRDSEVFSVAFPVSSKAGSDLERALKSAYRTGSTSIGDPCVDQCRLDGAVSEMIFHEVDRLAGIEKVGHDGVAHEMNVAVGRRQVGKSGCSGGTGLGSVSRVGPGGRQREPDRHRGARRGSSEVAAPGFRREVDQAEERSIPEAGDDGEKPTHLLLGKVRRQTRFDDHGPPRFPRREKQDEGREELAPDSSERFS